MCKVIKTQTCVGCQEVKNLKSQTFGSRIHSEWKMIDEVNMHKDEHRRNQTECMTRGNAAGWQIAGWLFCAQELVIVEVVQAIEGKWA